MKNYKTALGLLMVLTMTLALGCPPDDKSDEVGEDTLAADLVETPDDTVAPLDGVDEDLGAPPEDTTAEDIPPVDLVSLDTVVDPCDDPAALREDALTNGTQILAGLALEASTPIAAIVAAPEDYEGQLVQIEGLVTELCDEAGCWAKLSDPQGNSLVLKVEDGVIDFREVMETGRYAIGEGLFTEFGGHGAQVFIQDHGAVVGSILCALHL